MERVILDMLDDIKHTMQDGSYLKLCDMLYVSHRVDTSKLCRRGRYTRRLVLKTVHTRVLRKWGVITAIADAQRAASVQN